jgi:four helix bundle protein
MAPYEKLEAWQASYQLGLAIIRTTDRWPQREMFGLCAQARRFAYSVSLNIAEGIGKRGSREFRRYLVIALGSLFELEVVLRFAKDLEFSPEDEVLRLEEMRSKAGRLGDSTKQFVRAPRLARLCRPAVLPSCRPAACAHRPGR